MLATSQSGLVADPLAEQQVQGDSVPVPVSGSDARIHGRYQPLGDGSILRDTVTGLEWQRCSVGQSWSEDTEHCAGDALRFNWRDAAQQSAAGGFRTPTLDELSTLVYCPGTGQIGMQLRRQTCGDSSAYAEPTIVDEAFPNTPARWFWSSSAYASDADSAWYIYFNNGRIDHVNAQLHKRVRLVRAGESGDSDTWLSSALQADEGGSVSDTPVEPSGQSDEAEAVQIVQGSVAERSEPAGQTSPVEASPVEASPVVTTDTTTIDEEVLVAAGDAPDAGHEPAGQASPVEASPVVTTDTTTIDEEVLVAAGDAPDAAQDAVDAERDAPETAGDTPEMPGHAIDAAAESVLEALIVRRYLPVGDGALIRDTVTGLEWQRCAIGQLWSVDTQECTGEALEFTWSDAAQLETSDGFRTPTIDELRTLVYCSNTGQIGMMEDFQPCGEWGTYTSPTIAAEAFPNAPATWFWSASPSGYSGDDAWDIDFHSGRVSYFSKDTHYRVRLVRTAESL